MGGALGAGGLLLKLKLLDLLGRVVSQAAGCDPAVDCQI